MRHSSGGTMTKLAKQSALVLAFCCVAALAGAQGGGKQAAPRRASANATVSAGAPDRAYLQKVWDAWGTLDPANAAPYYSKDPQNVFYDLTPMKYTGWSEYETGVKALLAGFRSLKVRVDDDAHIQTRDVGSLANA